MYSIRYGLLQTTYIHHCNIVNTGRWNHIYYLSCLSHALFVFFSSVGCLGCAPLEAENDVASPLYTMPALPKWNNTCTPVLQNSPFFSHASHKQLHKQHIQCSPPRGSCIRHGACCHLSYFIALPILFFFFTTTVATFSSYSHKHVAFL